MSEEVKARGRKSALAGKALYPNCEESPRKKGSKGDESYTIIASNPGITYEDFRAKGGHPGYVRLEVEQGNVRAE